MVVSLLPLTEPAMVDQSAKYFPFTQWTTRLVELIGSSAEEQLTRVKQPGYSSFDVPSLDLQLASDRWVLRWPEHPEITLEDLRARILPEPTKEEIWQRKKAIQEARQLRASLDITPLTTSALIRRLRDGSDKG